MAEAQQVRSLSFQRFQWNLCGYQLLSVQISGKNTPEKPREDNDKKSKWDYNVRLIFWTAALRGRLIAVIGLGQQFELDFTRAAGGFFVGVRGELFERSA